MRDDFDKVITERPRYGSDLGVRHLKGRSRKYYNLTGKVARLRDKSFKDHLAPLFRFLHSCVGRLWDEVWSEICQKFDKRNGIAAHFRLHVKMAVWRTGGNWRGKEFWVDQDGILRRAGNFWEYLRQDPTPSPKNYLVLGDRLFRKQKGIWYEVAFEAMVDRHSYFEMSWDNKTYHYIKTEKVCSYAQRCPKCLSSVTLNKVNYYIKGNLKQLSKQELKQLKLHNDRVEVRIR